MPPRLIHAGLLAPRRSGVQYHLCNLQRVAVAHKQHFAAAVCRLDARDDLVEYLSPARQLQIVIGEKGNKFSVDVEVPSRRREE